MKKYIGILFLALALGSCKKDKEEQSKIDDEILKQYIADNNLSATKTDSGLYYVIDEEGTGIQPVSQSSVRVVYKGYFTDGGEFDASSDGGSTFSLTGVIPGWTEGIPKFKEGGKGILLLPSSLGYGARGSGSIPGNTVLIFDIELIDVI